MADKETYTICIIGLGLMGGSLALALRQARPWLPAGRGLRLVGLDNDPATAAAARAAGAIDTVGDDLASAVATADAVVLAVPVRSILALLPQVGAYARPEALILDLGSSKAAVCAAMAALPAGLQPVGGHPMCGSEHMGFAAAHAGLYAGRTFALCPLPRTSAAARGQATALVTAAGARPLQVDADAHDAAVAGISHLPYIAAAALVRTVEEAGDPLAWALAASGFRDTTRVAAGSVDVMLDALLTNRPAVLACLDALAARLDLLRAALAAGDEAALRRELDAARLRRSELAAVA